MTLPLLAYTSSLYPDVDLSKTLVIGCQHLLGTTVDLFEELLKKGLPPENVFLIGKCYSTNATALKKLRKLGIQVSRYSRSYDSQVSFDEQFQGYLEKFLLAIKRERNFADFEKIIILDDGGHLLLFARDFFGEHAKIVGVEQTSSGYEQVKNIDLPFPVVNVARSHAKLEHESPLIAQIVVKNVLEYFTKAELVHPNVLVVGQGSIGSAITSLAKSLHAVEVHDVKNSSNPDFGNFDVIIGATGKTILSPGQFATLKKPVHLISASSSDREFSSVYLRRLAPPQKDCHTNITVDGIHLVNGGFPINFNGKQHSLPPEQAQLTRSLLLAGILEAQSLSLQPGLQDLSDIQDAIITKFVELR